MANKCVAKVSDWMKALSDFMISNPQARGYEAAAFFGVSETWLSAIKNSDAFIVYHAERRGDMSERVNMNMGERLMTLAEITVDEITERVETERDSMTLQQLQDVGKMALSAMGFGSRGGGVNVTVQQDNRSITVNDAEALRKSRELLRQNRQRNDEEIVQDRAQQVGVTVQI